MAQAAMTAPVTEEFVFQHAVEGLFLAGELVGGFHGPMPVSGTAICKAAIFGRTAGQNAAAAEPASLVSH